MRKNLRAIIAALMILPNFLHPCTTLSFLDDNNERIFGKVFDWNFGHGTLFVNKRFVKKEALMLEEGLTPVQWVSRYGSVTFSQHGREFPLGGMNEAGLVVEIMVGPTQDIENSANVRSINEVQIIQYMLDSFSTIDQLVAGLQNIRIARVVSDVHYLACDRRSNCASIEFLNGALEIHRGSDLPYNVFTNSTYAESSAYAAQFQGLGGSTALPTGGKSLERFARAASTAETYAGGDAIPYLHSFMDAVALSGRWRISYKGVREIQFRVDSALGVMKSISMAQDFNCRTPVKMYDMHKGSVAGDIQNHLVDYTKDQNDRLVNKNWLILGFGTRRKMRDYPATTECLNGFQEFAAAN